MRHTSLPLLVATAIVAPAFAEERQPAAANDDWMQTYYRKPTPARFVDEMQKLRAMGILKSRNAQAPLASFCARLFADATPAQLATWDAYIDTLPDEEKPTLLVALRWADTPESSRRLATREAAGGKIGAFAAKLRTTPAPKLESLGRPGPAELDMCWGAFFASGKPEYAHTVIRCASAPETPGTVDLAHMAARWSLKSLCGTHPRVRAITDDFMKTTTPERKASLEALLAPESPKPEAAAVAPESALEKEFRAVTDSVSLAKFIAGRRGKLPEKELRAALTGDTSRRITGYDKPIRLADVAGTIVDLDHPERLEKRRQRAVAEICSYIDAAGDVHRFHILSLDERDRAHLLATSPR